MNNYVYDDEGFSVLQKSLFTDPVRKTEIFTDLSVWMEIRKII